MGQPYQERESTARPLTPVSAFFSLGSAPGLLPALCLLSVLPPAWMAERMID